MKILTVAVIAAALWTAAPGAAAAADPPAAQDACGAAQYQSLVGKPVSAIPRTLRRPNVRIYSTADVVTQDYVEGRMNIVWDAKTLKIVRVKCG